ncbi:hypothetical protein UlMin_033219 [Ulmus minor]
MEINFDLDFHPSENLFCATLVNGDLLIYRFSSNSVPQKILEVHAHTESCRAVWFIDDGCAIVTGSPDCFILAIDVETGGTIARLEDTHGEAINKIINLYQSKIASRDDGGCIKVWDTKQRSCCGTYQAHEDYIFDMTFVLDTMKLLGTRLSLCNLQKETKVQARSEFSEEELLSVFLVKVHDYFKDKPITIYSLYIDAGLNSIYMTICLGGFPTNPSRNQNPNKTLKPRPIKTLSHFSFPQVRRNDRWDKNFYGLFLHFFFYIYSKQSTSLKVFLTDL